jgi:acetate kinase
MNSTEPSILTINAGSSSIKFALFTGNRSPRLILKGHIARIGTPDVNFFVQAAGQSEKTVQPVSAENFPAAVASLLDWIEECIKDHNLVAVGHRIVHGGRKYYQPTLVADVMIEDLRELVSLDPEHLPQAILLVESIQRRLPILLQIACFDTAFHHDMPRVAQLMPIPRRYMEQGIRRYGFHGLSYEFLMGELARIDGIAVAKGRVVLAHLGNGASLAAVLDGMPIDTSMGFTPAAGVLMGTRCGDLDPGVIAYLASTEAMSPEQFNHMIHFESGLLGVSETSADMRDLLLLELEDARAAEAVALFCYQIKKWIGAYAAVLGGIDTLIFSGGIGENAPVVRAKICAGLEFLGIELDPKLNKANADLISSAMAGANVRVIHTNEELVMARSVYRLIGREAE